MMKKATPEEAVAEIFVYWDIKRFPVPPGFDARRIRPCLAQFLERYGYCGHLTINAVGILTNVHDEILEALSSTGINLYYAPFGCSSLLSLMSRCIFDNPPPANILAICDPIAFPYPADGFNIFGPFVYSSPKKDAVIWIRLILAESAALEEEEEDTCCETDDSASWFCFICRNLRGQGFKSFSTHFSSLEHLDKRSTYSDFQSLEYVDISREEDKHPPTIVRKEPKMASPEEALAETFVFWDMKQFPVPTGFDALQVRPCITRFLEKYGYSGPLTITAVGDLSGIPDHTFQALSSTEIRLCQVKKGVRSVMSRWISENSPPANILGICAPTPSGFPPPPSGYNIFRPFSYSSPQQDSILWESLILAVLDPCHHIQPPVEKLQTA